MTTLIECIRCRHYMGQAEGEPYCAHPQFGQPCFYDIPFEKCFTPYARKQHVAKPAAITETVNNNKTKH